MGILQKFAADVSGSASEVDLLAAVTTTSETILKSWSVNQGVGTVGGIYRLTVGSNVISRIDIAGNDSKTKAPPDGLARIASGGTFKVTQIQGTPGDVSVEIFGSTKNADLQD